MATVVVVDDDDALREAVVASLQSVGLEVEGFASASAFLDRYLADALNGALADSSVPRCAVMDVRMPGLSGLEALRRLRESGSSLPVVFVTGHGDVEMAVSAMKLGAVDFLQKPFREQKLIDLVQAMLASTASVQSAESGQDAPRKQALDEQLKKLTQREREVFLLVADGLRSKQIAGVMGISEKTVEEYRRRIFEKLEVKSAPMLASLATEMRMLKLLQ
ncbi:Two-component response regulator [gamma proteobacterium HdN1]|nr:Two-component response regulator [gamma proteobacterium HdN1]